MSLDDAPETTNTPETAPDPSKAPVVAPEDPGPSEAPVAELSDDQKAANKQLAKDQRQQTKWARGGECDVVDLGGGQVEYLAGGLKAIFIMVGGERREHVGEDEHGRWIYR